MNAKIITIGDEILIGQVIDTNSAWLASELTALGFKVSEIVSISDKGNSIAEMVNVSLEQNSLVVLTGGLGPTNDDITKKTLAGVFNMELQFNDTVYSDIIAFLEMRGVPMNQLNRDQALFPVGAKLLRNRQGTAPGMWFEKDGSIVISLPGVPWEMKSIFKNEFLPQAKVFFKLPELYYQTVMITGIAESHLAERISEWEMSLPKNIGLAYLPSPGIIRLRLGIAGNDKHNIRSIIQQEIEKLHNIIPEYIYSDTEITLQEAIGKILKNRGETISTAESCTGGNIASMITSIAGSSAYFKGAVVAYSNEIKESVLGVDSSALKKYGAVSERVVIDMANGVKKLMKTDYSVATSGIAGPSGGTTDKPVGTVWIAIAGKKRTIAKKITFGKERDFNIKRSSIAALNMLIKELRVIK